MVSLEGLASLPTPATWEWSSQLELLENPPEILSLYVGAQELLRESVAYNTASSSFDAHLRALKEAQVGTSICRYEFIPESVLVALAKARERAAIEIAGQLNRPMNYELMLKAEKITREIANQEVLLDISRITSAKQVELLRKRNSHIRYDIRGTVTGRLTTKKDSIPILTMSRNDRGFIVPTNDLLIEFDFNAAELRVLLALSDLDQPTMDVHEWNKREIYGNSVSRVQAKEAFFAWLYNPNSFDDNLARIYNKDAFRRHYNGGSITTPFERVLKVEERKALNYLIQSTASDLAIEQAFKVRELLKDRKSFLKALLHDSIVLDVSKEDLPLLKDVYFAFRETRFGRFVVNVKTGEDFYNMREVKWKT